MLEIDEMPAEYSAMSIEELEAKIISHKKAMGESLCILGHHYQRDEVVALADFVGDSLKLSQQAAKQTAKHIVFCGVHFMAESADILSSDEQTVILPNMRAGCAMADMAQTDAVAAAVEELAALSDEKIVPISYVNSTADIKAITANGDGACCTSSNAKDIFTWALKPADQGGAGADKLFCLPDQHLARNTAVALGYSLDQCVMYDPTLPNGGLTKEDLAKAKFILWAGCCYVHQLFSAEDVARVRAEHPDIKVMVHPECPYEVVSIADMAGSTENIIQAVTKSPAGSKWAIATESNLVNRLATQNPDKFICVLSAGPAICTQMKQVDLPHLAWVLDKIAQGEIVNQVSVSHEIAEKAKLALERMIAAY